MIDVLMNKRWTLKLPEHRRDQWAVDWERERLDAMYVAIRPGDVVLDVGAEQGDISALCASWGAKMILAEPSPGFWPNIKATFRANKLPDPILSFQGLIFNESKSFHLADGYFLNAGWPTAADGILNGREIGFTHVNENPIMSRLTIDDLPLGDRLDIITMDIEGTEYEALLGAETTIQQFRPIIFLSIHPEFMWREHEHTVDDLLFMMHKWGYDGTFLAFDHEKHYMFKPRPYHE